MAIDTVSMYHPGMKFPLWLKVSTPKQNDYKEGETYEIRIEDSDRAEEQEGGNTFNYTHEAILVGKWERKLDEVPREVLGYAANADTWGKTKERLFPHVSGVNDLPETVLVLCFLRIDRAMELVMEGPECIPNDFNKEVIEN